MQKYRCSLNLKLILVIVSDMEQTILSKNFFLKRYMLTWNVSGSYWIIVKLLYQKILIKLCVDQIWLFYVCGFNFLSLQR